MTASEIEKLREKFIIAARSERSNISLDRRQMDYLIHLMRSHIIWKNWLVPDE